MATAPSTASPVETQNCQHSRQPHPKCPLMESSSESATKLLVRRRARQAHDSQPTISSESSDRVLKLTPLLEKRMVATDASKASSENPIFHTDTPNGPLIGRVEPSSSFKSLIHSFHSLFQSGLIKLGQLAAATQDVESTPWLTRISLLVPLAICSLLLSLVTVAPLCLFDHLSLLLFYIRSYHHSLSVYLTQSPPAYYLAYGRASLQRAVLKHKLSSEETESLSKKPRLPVEATSSDTPIPSLTSRLSRALFSNQTTSSSYPESRLVSSDVETTPDSNDSAELAETGQAISSVPTSSTDVRSTEDVESLSMRTPSRHLYQSDIQVDDRWSPQSSPKSSRGKCATESAKSGMINRVLFSTLWGAAKEHSVSSICQGLLCLTLTVFQFLPCLGRALLSEVRTARTQSSKIRVVRYLNVAQLLLSHLPRWTKQVWVTAEQFRETTILNPPAFPLSSVDAVFGTEDDDNQFYLSMLFETEPIATNRVQAEFVRRLTTYEHKLRSILRKRFGRLCWDVVPDFDIKNHVYEVQYDCHKHSLAPLVSELLKEPWRPDRPQWIVWVIQYPGVRDGSTVRSPCPYGSEKLEEDGLNCVTTQSAEDCSQEDKHSNEWADPPRTYLVGKWGHTIADGSGLMSAIVSRMGDVEVGRDCLPAKYKQEVPYWKACAYYSLVGFQMVFRGLRCLLEPFSWLDYPALLDHSHTGPPLIASGRRHHSRPGCFLLSELKETQTLVREVASRLRLPSSDALLKPTVNDLFCWALGSAINTLKDEKAFSIELRRLIAPGLLDSGKNLEWKSDYESLAAYCHTIIPVMCRTNIPTSLDNCTSLVPVALPLPPPCLFREADTQSMRYDKIRQALESVQATRIAMNRVKQLYAPSWFVAMSTLAKALHRNTFRKVFKNTFGKVQLCFTNVAAPPIASDFCGQHVHRLSFWPAVPRRTSCGASLISLGDSFQFMTVIDQVEIQPIYESMVEIAKEAHVANVPLKMTQHPRVRDLNCPARCSRDHHTWRSNTEPDPCTLQVLRERADDILVELTCGALDELREALKEWCEANHDNVSSSDPVAIIAESHANR